MRWNWQLLSLALVAVSTSLSAGELRLLPAEATLQGREATQQVVLQNVEGELLTSQVRQGVTFSSDHPEIAKVSSSGIIEPVADGVATITAKVGEQTATAKVTVVGSAAPHAWSFRNDVQPVLAKTGCNMGACHGALAGKGGFRLSLRGYDPVADYFNIVKQDRGRRVELAAPGRSLFLAKPTGAIAHRGGMRFDVSRDVYFATDEVGIRALQRLTVGKMATGAVAGLITAAS